MFKACAGATLVVLTLSLPARYTVKWGWLGLLLRNKNLTDKKFQVTSLYSTKISNLDGYMTLLISKSNGAGDESMKKWPVAKQWCIAEQNKKFGCRLSKKHSWRKKWLSIITEGNWDTLSAVLNDKFTREFHSFVIFWHYNVTKKHN